jgi:lipopolysaccharide transport system permease protein
MKKTYERILTFLKYRELFVQLVTREIKIKYRKSILGYLWSVLNPLLTMIVLIIVFSNLFSRGVSNFPVYLLTGQLLFNFMVISTSRSLSSVVGNSSLLKKIYVPKYIFTFSVVTSELVTFFFSLGALIVVILFTGAPVTWHYIFIFIPIAELYIFCIGIGLFLAQAYVFFRDIEYIWSVITTAWLYLSAIFYPVNILPGKIHFLVTNFNPMYFYITLFRNFTIGSQDIGSFNLVIRGAVTSVLALFLGLISFSHNKKKFILYM